jgi:hypothetical protein
MAPMSINLLPIFTSEQSIRSGDYADLEMFPISITQSLGCFFETTFPPLPQRPSNVIFDVSGDSAVDRSVSAVRVSVELNS